MQCSAGLGQIRPIPLSTKIAAHQVRLVELPQMSQGLELTCAPMHQEPLFTAHQGTHSALCPTHPAPAPATHTSARAAPQRSPPDCLSARLAGVRHHLRAHAPAPRLDAVGGEVEKGDEGRRGHDVAWVLGPVCAEGGACVRVCALVCVCVCVCVAVICVCLLPETGS